MNISPDIESPCPVRRVPHNHRGIDLHLELQPPLWSVAGTVTRLLEFAPLRVIVIVALNGGSFERLKLTAMDALTGATSMVVGNRRVVERLTARDSHAEAA
jgi:hypothetical protein